MFSFACLYSLSGADRDSDGWGLGGPLAFTGLSNLSKAWLFLDFKNLL